MPLDIVTIPCRTDNYAYLVKGPDGTCIIDAPKAEPIIAACEARGWTPGVLMITHHHPDHTAGTEALREKYGLKVMGPQAEEAKLPPLDMALAEGMNGGEGEGYTEPLSVPGHTLGHIAFHFPRAKALFSADSLMAWGCGRVFEGTMDMQYATMCKLAALPPDTMVYSGHEYTTSNGKFALSLEPDNPALISRMKAVEEARSRGEPTAQVPLSLELETNPFLRCDTPELRAAVGMPDAPAAEVFAEVRRRKDNF